MADNHQDGYSSENNLAFISDESNVPADAPSPSSSSSSSSSSPSTQLRVGESEPSSPADVSGLDTSRLIQPQPSKPSPPSDVQSREAPAEQTTEVEKYPCGEEDDADPVCSQFTMSNLKSSPEISCTLHNFSRCSRTQQSTSSLSKKALELQESGDELCASLVLACVFCRLEECVSAMLDVCQLCLSSTCSSLCSKVCCCSPASLEPFLELCPDCDPAACLHTHCPCRAAELSFCDVCIHATECLDLGMEVSQLLFH